jgi:AcrR family transcriptional regulator
MTRAAPLSPKERRESLLLAATVVFGERGYYATSVTDIIERAGVARGTFYNHFESKRDVFAAVLAGLIAQVGASVRPIDVTSPVFPQLEANLVGMATALARIEDGARILFTDALSIDRDGEEALAAFYAHALARIEKALTDGQRLGIIRPGEVRQTARCLLGMLKEPVIQARLAGESLDPDALAGAILGVLRGGVLTA